MNLTLAPSVFEYTNIVPRFSAASHTIDLATGLQPDLSVKRARTSIRGYVPGVSPSLAAFLVFGTTKTFQEKMYSTFVPKIFQRQNRKKRNPSMSVDVSNPAPPPPPSRRADPYDEEVSLDAMSPKTPPSANFSRKLPSRGGSIPSNPFNNHSRIPSRSEAPHFKPVQFDVPAARVTPDLTLPKARALSPIVIPTLHSKFSTLRKHDPEKEVLPHTTY
ncbi:hypothetical protein LZ31DRAFT_373819 [Colletotrichum somersetense]|nr:hypothetical protein LZ31DRAFT_373819 [Colletotrichum somersetense]